MRKKLFLSAALFSALFNIYANEPDSRVQVEETYAVEMNIAEQLTGSYSDTNAENADKISGTWSGKLQVTPAASIRLVFHISPESVTMDSPDQGAKGIACTLDFLSADSVSISSPQLHMTYSAKLSGNSLVGTFKQGGLEFPLTLTPGEKKVFHPQTPVPPFPYSTEEVVITTPDASLAGTLTLPENANAETPVVVMVTGSGQQNRDEELFEHKPFAVIADYLARNGIASLRYDDRGFGASTGDAFSATTADFANDAEAVADYLKKSGRFGKIGLLGHSEGGMIGYILGSGNKLDFIVSIAGPSIKGSKTIAYQNKIALLKSGLPESTASEFATALEKVFDYKLQNHEIAEVDDALVAKFYPSYDSDQVTRQLATQLKTMLTQPVNDANVNPWMMWFLEFDPAGDLQKISAPMFIIYGEKDLQVPPSLNEQPARANAPSAVVKVYPGLNHLMQHAATGNVEEYKEIEETISPEVLSDIVSFIRKNQ